MRLSLSLGKVNTAVWFSEPKVRLLEGVASVVTDSGIRARRGPHCLGGLR